MLCFVAAAVRVARRGNRGARGSYDLGSYQDIKIITEIAGIVFQDTASALFGVEGLQVTDVQAGPDGVLEVWAVTDSSAAAACPDCGTVSSRAHELVVTRHAGVSWPVAHDAFAAATPPVLDQPAAPAAHLGIDEHRRGRPRWRHNEATGEYVQLADRWHTCFYDLSGRQGMLGQAEGRTADAAAYWLAGATPAWRDAVQVVAIDMCTIYLSAVRRMLPHAAVAVDLFHVVQLAVKTTGDVRRRAIREKYGRRGRSGDPEYGLKSLLARNLEYLSPDQFAKVIETLDRDGGQQIAIAWIAKEELRDALNLRARVTGSVPCERQARDRLFTFYDWCAQHDAVPELVTLASTISRWEDQIVCAILTGVTNARSESLNRIAKLEARLAYGFRNPANQRRRVRIACTRGTRRRPPDRTRKRTRKVTRQRHDPG